MNLATDGNIAYLRQKNLRNIFILKSSMYCLFYAFTQGGKMHLKNQVHNASVGKYLLHDFCTQL